MVVRFGVVATIMGWSRPLLQCIDRATFGNGRSSTVIAWLSPPEHLAHAPWQARYVRLRPMPESVYVKQHVEWTCHTR